MGRPSLDSAAGSVSASSLGAPRRANPTANGQTSTPGLIVEAGGGIGLVEASNLLQGDALGRGSGWMPKDDGVNGNSKRSVPEVHDDDAASQYAASSVAQQQQQLPAGSSKGPTQSEFSGGTGEENCGPRRPPRFGGIAGGTTGTCGLVEFWIG